jgi:prepilin-type N-terminal cleavage/methylation domain-containing protein
MYWSSLPCKKSHCGSNGFTLIEVLVALTILAGGIPAVLAAFSLCVRTDTHSSRQAEALTIAQRELQLAIIRQKAKAGSQGLYNWAVNIQEKEYGLLLAAVQINWTERGKNQTLTLSQVFLPREVSS